MNLLCIVLMHIMCMYHYLRPRIRSVNQFQTSAPALAWSASSRLRLQPWRGQAVPDFGSSLGVVRRCLFFLLVCNLISNLLIVLVTFYVHALSSFLYKCSLCSSCLIYSFLIPSPFTDRRNFISAFIFTPHNPYFQIIGL
jgi:hypothetical protein